MSESHGEGRYPILTPELRDRLKEGQAFTKIHEGIDYFVERHDTGATGRLVKHLREVADTLETQQAELDQVRKEKI